MTQLKSPSVDLEGFDHLVVAYDRADDIAFIHIDGPRPASTEQVDDGWYIRLDDDDEIVGLELHGLKRLFLSTPFFARVFKPAIEELEAFTGRSFETDSFRAEGTVGELPRTTHLLILMLGQSFAKYEALQRSEYEDAGRRLLEVG